MMIERAAARGESRLRRRTARGWLDASRLVLLPLVDRRSGHATVDVHR